MEMFNSRRLTNIGVVAAIYVVLTVALGGLAYGAVQFRVSEALVLLCLFNKDYIISMTLGCLIANIFSTVGPIDTVVGTAATLISVLLIYASRNHLPMVVCSLFPVIVNGVFVGAELKLVSNLPFLLSFAEVAFGELVCVTFIGVVIFRTLKNNKRFMSMVTFGRSADEAK